MVKRKLQKALALLMAISMSVSLMSVMVLAEERRKKHVSTIR